MIARVYTVVMKTYIHAAVILTEQDEMEYKRGELEDSVATARGMAARDKLIVHLQNLAPGIIFEDLDELEVKRVANIKE